MEAARVSGEGFVFSRVSSPIGPLLVGANREGICLLEFTGPRRWKTQLETLRRRLSSGIEPGENEHTRHVGRELDLYFAGQLRSFAVPFAAAGSDFERRVWRAVGEIPYGQTRSYGDLARALGVPLGFRAVGRANGRNPVSILIPCHRVVGSGGKLIGYGGGLWRKEHLLELERGQASLLLTR